MPTDTSGFYKIDMVKGGLLFAPNFVNGPGINLTREAALDALSIDPKAVITGGDWTWYASDSAAYAANNITPNAKPWVVTPLQARIALSDAGLLANAEAIVASADAKTKLAWEYASEFNRSSPLLNTLATALGLSSTQMDDLFTAASKVVI